jgi:hypothetical protein
MTGYEGDGYLKKQIERQGGGGDYMKTFIVESLEWQATSHQNKKYNF